MSVLPLLRDPDPRLRLPSRSVDIFDAALERLASDMLKTMYHHGGIGLAAPQVNVRRRVIAADVSERGDTPLVLVNPVCRAHEASQTQYKEGCLSLPGLHVAVERFTRIRVEAQDVRGERILVHADGWLAICLQHEMDHLDGCLLSDFLAPGVLARYRRKQGIRT